jgi:uncharacterized membrane protein YvlD (DUF360 family)
LLIIIDLPMYLFTYGLFINTISSSYYIVSDMMQNELGRMWKEAVID